MRRATTPLLVVLVVAGLLLHIGVGASVWLTPLDIARALAGGPNGSDANATIVWLLRLPRAAEAALVGAILGLVGACFQSLFRNPLAEPYIVGASSGAALGGAAVAAAGLGSLFFGLAVHAAAFAGGLGVLALVFALAGGRSAEPGPLLLAGVAVSALAGALLSLVILGAGLDAGVLLRWLLGSTSAATPKDVLLLGVSLALGYAYLARQGRRLNALALGGLAAEGVGVDVAGLRRNALLVGTALTAVAVGAVGIIGFLGLVAPHLARMLLGGDTRKVLPAATLLGAALLLLADVLAGRGVHGGEIPVGVVCAALGAPLLLILLAKSNRRHTLSL